MLLLDDSWVIHRFEFRYIWDAFQFSQIKQFDSLELLSRVSIFFHMLRRWIFGGVNELWALVLRVLKVILLIVGFIALFSYWFLSKSACMIAIEWGWRAFQEAWSDIVEHYAFCTKSLLLSEHFLLCNHLIWFLLQFVLFLGNLHCRHPFLRLLLILIFFDLDIWDAELISKTLHNRFFLILFYLLINITVNFNSIK